MPAIVLAVADGTSAAARATQLLEHVAALEPWGCRNVLGSGAVAALSGVLRAFALSSEGPLDGCAVCVRRAREAGSERGGPSWDRARRDAAVGVPPASHARSRGCAAVRGRARPRRLRCGRPSACADARRADRGACGAAGTRAHVAGRGRLAPDGPARAALAPALAHGARSGARLADARERAPPAAAPCAAVAADDGRAASRGCPAGRREREQAVEAGAGGSGGSRARGRVGAAAHTPRGRERRRHVRRSVRHRL
eukprot:7384982-Prymnesium_polylepis.1